MTALFVTDLDGTLLGSSGDLATSSSTVLRRLLAGGGLFTFCTARGITDSAKALSDLPLALPAGYYNGALIARPDTGEVLVEHTLPAVLAGPIVAALRAAGGRPQLIGRLGNEQVVFLEAAGNAAEMAFHAARAGWDTRLRLMPAYPVAVDAAYGLVCLDALDQVARWAELITEAYGAGVDVKVFEASEAAGYGVLQVTAGGVDKGTAVRRIAELAGVDPSRLVVFGDSANDIPMFGTASRAYATSNATVEVKALATEVIPGNDDHGVARKISELMGWTWS